MEIIGYTNEQERMTTSIQNNDPFNFLIAEWGFGKTTILHALKETLTKTGARTVYVPVSDKETFTWTINQTLSNWLTRILRLTEEPFTLLARQKHKTIVLCDECRDIGEILLRIKQTSFENPNLTFVFALTPTQARNFAEVYAEVFTRMSPTNSVTLRGLNEEEMLELLRNKITGISEANLMQAVVESKRNPLKALQLAREYQTNGTVAKRAATELLPAEAAEVVMVKGVSPSEQKIIDVLKTGTGLRPRELSEKTGVKPESLYVMLNRLGKKGAIRKVGSQYYAYAQQVGGDLGA